MSGKSATRSTPGTVGKSTSSLKPRVRGFRLVIVGSTSSRSARWRSPHGCSTLRPAWGSGSPTNPASRSRRSSECVDFSTPATLTRAKIISIPSPLDEERLMPLNPRTQPTEATKATEATESRPTWTQLPTPARQEVVRLLTQMLLAHARRPLARPARGGDHERRQ
jgi:hypothetical protein